MFHICSVFTFLQITAVIDYQGLTQLLTDHLRNKGSHWPGPLPLPLVHTSTDMLIACLHEFLIKCCNFI